MAMMPDPPQPPWSDEPFDAWLATLGDAPALTAKGRRVVAALRQQARLTSFGSSRDLAEAAGVNVGTVVRAAQCLGYSGWKELQHEFRSRYLASLSASEVAHEHDLTESTALAAFAKDRADLSYLSNTVTRETVRDIASDIAAARRTLVLGQGSYAAVAVALGHNASIAGYDVRYVSDAIGVANGISQLEAGDLLIVINSWQIFASTFTALNACAKRRIKTVLITDSASPGTRALASKHVSVPSESVAFFPSLVGALSLAQAVVVELAAIDPQRTRFAIARSEEEWNEFDLMRRELS